MADISQINLDGTSYLIKDEQARTTATAAQSTANSAQSTATTANSTANTAKSTADTAKTTADSALSKANKNSTDISNLKALSIYNVEYVSSSSTLKFTKQGV